MRPIQTVYQGYKFRSRLEARWAVFFDALKIKWEYEPEGYHLSNGEMYLPDFYLPGFCDRGIYAEVKPDQVVDPKAQMLARDSGIEVLMLCGVPSPSAYHVIYGNGEVGVALFSAKYLPGGSHKEEYRLFYEPGFGEDGDLSINESEMDHSLLAAIVRARSARFEHGEKGASL